MDFSLIAVSGCDSFCKKVTALVVLKLGMVICEPRIPFANYNSDQTDKDL